MNGSKRTIGLVLLAMLALGLRLGLVLTLRTDHAAPVSYEHGRIAENLLAGQGFSIEFLGVEGPTSQQAPFYPLLLAAVYACLGVETPATILAVQLLQCLAGTALVLAAVCLGWVLVPDRPSVGWVVGFAAAIYPTHLYMVTHLQVALPDRYGFAGAKHHGPYVAPGIAAVLVLPRGRRQTRDCFPEVLYDLGLVLVDDDGGGCPRDKEADGPVPHLRTAGDLPELIRDVLEVQFSGGLDGYAIAVHDQVHQLRSHSSSLLKASILLG